MASSWAMARILIRGGNGKGAVPNIERVRLARSCPDSLTRKGSPLLNHRFCNLARAARLGRALSAVVLASAALLSAPAHVGAQSVSEQVWVLPTGGTNVLW